MLLPRFMPLLVILSLSLALLSLAHKDVGYKYFREPLEGHLEHYDARFFTKNVPESERSAALQHLVRAFLSIFRERKIEVWLAHGTLLGWWWNGKVMPWDTDLDVQVSDPTLAWLGTNLNSTFHNYTFFDATTEKEVVREYFLDLNPFYTERVRGDGLNIIDARFIDVRNGLYIDITGLSETAPKQEPGTWKCKNDHLYNIRDIYPLRESEFEGVAALIPYAFDKVLVSEYSSKALTKTEHKGHLWDAIQKEWVPADAGRKIDHNGLQNGRGWKAKSIAN